VPYWRFDKAAPTVFSPEFMGVTEPNVPFSPGPALARWIDPLLGSLNRDPTDAPADGLVDGSIPSQFNESYVIFRAQLESQFHSGVHRKVGGWLATAASPADPVFFLLHANVDRVWAHWQAGHDRFNSLDEQSYSAQGRFPGSGPDAGVYALGVYGQDVMWPWGYSRGSATNLSNWPDVDHPMPGNDQRSARIPLITPGGQVDYLDVNGQGVGLGYCYDDINFFGQVISD
jgi:tyrosinase